MGLDVMSTATRICTACGESFRSPTGLGRAEYALSPGQLNLVRATIFVHALGDLFKPPTGDRADEQDRDLDRE
jgi:hypothetical protein